MRYPRLAAAIAASLAFTATTAWGDDQAEAERHFEAGVALQKLEDFEAASAAFEASLDLYPTKAALFNLANCLRATHRYTEALEALQRLSREYGDRLDGPMRAAVDRQIEELLNLTAVLTVQVEPAGATVHVDGRLVGQSPLPRPIRLSPGPHRVEAALDGYESASITVNLVSRDQVTREIVLERPAPEPVAEAAPPPTTPTQPVVVPPPTPSPDRAGSSTYLTASWITVGAGAALLAGSAVTGIWALSVDADLSDACTDGHCPTSRQADVDRLDTLAVTTDVLLGAGLTVAAVGVAMLALAPAASESAEASAPLQVAVGPGYLGARLRQRF